MTSPSQADKIRACRCGWPDHEEWAQAVERDDASLVAETEEGPDRSTP